MSCPWTIRANCHLIFHSASRLNNFIKVIYSKAWLDFMGVWVTEEEVLEQPGEGSVGQDLLAMELR